MALHVQLLFRKIMTWNAGQWQSEWWERERERERKRGRESTTQGMATSTCNWCFCEKRLRDHVLVIPSIDLFPCFCSKKYVEHLQTSLLHVNINIQFLQKCFLIFFGGGLKSFRHHFSNTWVVFSVVQDYKTHIHWTLWSLVFWKSSKTLSIPFGPGYVSHRHKRTIWPEIQCVPSSSLWQQRHGFPRFCARRRWYLLSHRIFQIKFPWYVITTLPQCPPNF